MSGKTQFVDTEKEFSGELLQTILAQAADGIFVADERGRYIDVNPCGCEMLGYSREEILTLSIRDLVAPEDIARNPLKLDELRKGKAIVTERLLCRKDRSLLPVEINARILSNGYLLGIVRDNTERRRVEHLLAALNRSAQAMASAVTPDDIFSFVSYQLKAAGIFCVVLPFDQNRNGYIPRYLSIGPELLHQLESLTRIRHEDFVIPEDALDVFVRVRLENRAVLVEDAKPVIHQALPKRLKKLAPQIVKALQHPKFIAAPMIADDTFYGIFSAESNDLTENDIPPITAFAHQVAISMRKAELFQQAQNEIAERKRIEEKISRNERRFRALIENGLDPISLLAADGSLLWESPATVRGLGYKPNEFIGRNIFELMHPEDVETIRPRFAKLIQEPGSRQDSTFRMRHADGTWRWVEAVATNMLDDPIVEAVVINYRDVTQRLKAEETVKHSEERYRHLFESHPHPMLVYDLKTLAILAVNDATVEKYGYSRKEFLSMTIVEIRPEEDRTRFIEYVSQPRTALRHSEGWKHRVKDGTLIDVEVSSHTLLFDGHEAALVVVHDVTERKKAEARIEYVTRLYATLSQVNQTILRVKERGALFQAICRVAVEFGQFRMAWIGLLDEQTGNVNPVAYAGYEEGYLQSLNINLYDERFKSGPTRSAIRTGEVQLVNNTESDPHFEPWREQAAQRNYHSFASVPLRLKDTVIGVLNLYAAEPGFFTEEELALLEEIGQDITFALDMMGKEEDRLRLMHAIEHSVNEIYMFDPVTLRFEYANQGALHNLGYTFAQLQTMTPLDLKPDFTEASFRELIAPLLKGESDTIVFTTVHRRADQSTYPIEVYLQMIKQQGKSIFLTVILDVTERKRAEAALQNSERRYRRVLSDMMEGSQIIDHEWRYIYINDAAARQGQHSPDELLMHTMMEMYPGIEETELFRVLRVCMEERRAHRMENQFLFPDGTKGWFELSIQPVPEGLFILSIDITERKQAEENYRNIFENAREGIFQSTPGGTFLNVNPAMAHIYGYSSPQEMIQSVKDISRQIYMNPGDRNEFIGQMKMYGEVRNFEDLAIRKDGKAVWTSTTARAVRNEQGDIAYYEGFLQDITSQKLAEDALRASEDRYHDLVENSRELICTHDLEGRILSANQWALKMMDIAREDDLIGKNIVDYIPLEYRALFRDYLETMQREGSAQGVMVVQKANGERRIWEYNNSLRTEGVATPIVRGMAIDVTERRRAEAQLQASEEKYRSLFNNVPDGVYRTTAEGRLLAANPALVQMLGYVSAEQLQAVNVADLYVNPNERLDLVNQASADNAVHNLEVRLKRKDGRHIVGLNNSRAVRDEKGAVLYFEGTLTDITERKRAVEALRASQEQLYTFIVQAPISIAMFDREMKYLAASQRWVNDYGRGHTDLIGLSHYDVNPDLPDSWKEAHQRGFAGETLHNDNDVWLKQDGTTGWLRWAVVPWRTPSGEIGGIILSAEDITESKKAEEKIQEQLSRIATLREIDQMITSSFDLRLTLNRIASQIEEQLGADASAILSFNPNTHTLDYVVTLGLHEGTIQKTGIQLGRGLAGNAALERRITHHTDLTAMRNSLPEVASLTNDGLVDYYGVPLIAKGQLRGILEVYHRSTHDPEPEWLEFLETIAGQAAIAIDNTQMFEGLQHSNYELMHAYDATIEGWSRALDLRDKETEGHTQRVTEMTVELGRVYGLDPKELVNIRRGALLHDIGKMGVPDAILLKPGALTEDEWELMKKHPAFAYEMLSPIHYLRDALDIPHYHHEKWDGMGYPMGLKGDQIPLAARLFAVVDIWDAVRSDRPYRPAWSEEKALKYIRELSGTHLDPKVVDIFFESKIYRKTTYFDDTSKSN